MDKTSESTEWISGSCVDRVPSYEVIARRARVSRSTVSRVLRNDPRISEVTAKRVREAARVLGYRPNPLLVNLMERIRDGRNIAYEGTIAVVTEAEDAERWYGTVGSWMELDKGALQRAKERGYNLEYFSAQAFDRDGRRLSQIMRTRDIHGVYITPGFKDRWVRLEWERFSAATTGHGLIDPSLHRVCYNNYHGIQTACRQLRELGYKRIALYLKQRNHEVTDHNYVAGFLLFLESVPRPQQIRPCLVPRFTCESFKKWFERSRPDAVISSTCELIDWARQDGVRCPDDFGFVHLDCTARMRDCAGINHNSELIGRAVIDWIIAQIHRGETGLPVHPLTTVVEGCWVNGPSVRQKTAVAVGVTA